MKLTCTQDNFKKAIINAERVVSKQTTLPILNNILIETNKNQLNIVATNLEIGIEIKIGAKVEKEGRITVPARLLGSFSSNLIESGNLDIETDENNFKIKSGTTKALIKGFSADDFPLIPQKSSDYVLNIKTNDLRNIFSKVLFSVAHTEARQELTGVDLVFGEKQLFFASTDGFRLSEYVLDLMDEDYDPAQYAAFSTEGKNIIIPTSTLLELNRVISGIEDGRVKIFIEDGQIFFEIGEIKLVSRLINGKYPEYKHIMPKSYKTTIKGEKRMLVGALKLAGVFASNKANEVVLKIDPEKKNVVVDTKSVEAGENSTEIDFEAQGESQQIVFNLKYLMEGINALATEQLILSANSDSSPVALQEADMKSGQPVQHYTYIIMPIKN